MAKSKFFRIAVAGTTADGREIKPEWLTQMAETYALGTYPALLNCEHIAGYSPEAPFNCYGKVLSLKTEEVELSIGGEQKKLLALYAEIDANDQMLAVNKAGQKLFTSCEINPNFAGSGQAYLVGLAITDRPASLGTEPLKFAAMARANLFTVAHETALEIEPSTDGATLAEATKNGIIAAFAAMFKAPEKPKEEPASPPASQPAPANDNSFDVDRFATTMGTVIGDQIAAAVKPGNEAIAAFGQRLDALETKLGTTEQPQTFNRALATGGNASIVTNC